MTRVLITGAAGFIGSAAIKSFHDRGWECRGVDGLRTELYSSTIKRNRAQELAGHGVEDMLLADLLDLKLDEVLDGVDVLVHLAALPGQHASWSNFEAYVDCNLIATQRLAEACLRSNVSRVVHVSTSSVYGPSPAGDESQGCRPVNPYGVTKLAAEGIWRSYEPAGSFSTVCLRLFSVYGPGQRPDMGFYKMIRAALDGTQFPLHGGNQARDFTFVSDVTSAIRSAAECEAQAFEVLNISGGSTRPLTDAIEIIEREVGLPMQLELVDSPLGNQTRTSSESSKARQVLDFSPEVGLEQGLHEQVTWMLENLKEVTAGG